MDAAELLALVQNEAGWKKLLQSIHARRFPTEIPAIEAAGQGFVLALIASAAGRPLVLVVSDARRQEEVVAELDGWGIPAASLPELAEPVSDSVLPDEEVMSERLEIARRLQEDRWTGVLVVTPGSFEDALPAVKDARQLVISEKSEADPESLAALLEGFHYEPVSRVFARGQFVRRGGVLDVFSWHQRLPVRVEFFDREVESIREFNPENQTSIRRVSECSILPAFGSHDSLIPVRELVRDFVSVRLEGEDAHSCDIWVHSGPGEGEAVLPVHAAHAAAFDPGDFVLNEARRSGFFSSVHDWVGRGWTVALFCNNEGEWERFRELASENQVDLAGISCVQGLLSGGFLIPSARLAVLADAELFGRSATQRIQQLRKRRGLFAEGRAESDFRDFEEGDYVVHFEHGIGRFLGLQKLGEDDGREVLAVEYANEARLYVHLEDAWQVSRYVGVGKRRPDLSVLGDGRWEKAKSKARRGIFAYAKNLLSLQAARETSHGFAFPPDSHWQKEFEDSFLYQETVDQLKAILETKADMERHEPMDRLICGDVGFGKTEVAIRAVFKAVNGGRQVAFLAPTTVLAQQHYQTLRERMSEYPVRIELLSRYRTKSEQNRVVAGLKDGSVDVVIGTHRLVSGDVEFKQLGLLVVDEEQRFGVRHKERLKEKFPLVDVLTLSATPIPRTLYLALMGARDMSLIQTPPPNRKPVETAICGYDERIIRDAIRRELDRGGQVYFLHNRVRTIERVAARVRDLCPGVRVDIGHGQMPENDLEEVMGRFVQGQTDVLVATSIIESGLDIPNANTILIDRADLFGLADLYQLRGRVGRAGVKAYAYLMLPKSLVQVGEARKRISAIRQYSQLGSGFKIAMRDLEIRGAGNILGTAQSGHIITVGFDLYCKMLRNAVDLLRGETSAARKPAGLRVDFLATSEAEFLADSQEKLPSFLPASFLGDAELRIEAFRKLNEAANSKELDDLARHWRDRFGRLPEAVDNLLLSMRIRLEAALRKISLVEVRENKLMLSLRGEYLLISGKFPRLTRHEPSSKFREILDFILALKP
jgi:transcription-repair coupling factor (superfamily II helicase)